MAYSDVSLMIDGAWTGGANGRTIPVINPATEEVIGTVAHAEKSDLDKALAAADKGFKQWRKVSAYERYKIVRKASAALATGCSIIIKGPEDTPGSCAQLIKAFVDAGVPAGVIQLVYGVPSEISEYLIPHPIIKKITFTGSTPVGKQLAALAGAHMKRVTMELGGHAPAIVFEDADLEQAVNVLGA